MEPIDVAAGRLKSLIEEVADYKATILSEQDTRLKVVDRVLIEVMGWPRSEVATEAPSGSGYIDYKLTVDGLARLVLEAKRDGRDLGLKNRASGRPYKLDGPVFSTSSVKEGLGQAIRYCGQKNAELACVSNGREWIVFRGSRLGDGHDTMDGYAFVFSSLEEVHVNFCLFWDLLNYEAVTEFRYRAHFQEAEGRPIRTHTFRAALREPNSRLPLKRNPLSKDLDRVMTSFFQRLSGDADPDLLAKCFVVTRESQIADERLARISEDLIGRIRDLDTASGEQLTELIERARTTQRNEFVIVVGTKGAGKSTFIDRFFRLVLPKHLLRDCVVARVNLADSEGDEATIATWLDRRLLEELEEALFGDEVPTFDELQGMFYDEYQRRRDGTLRHLYQRDKEEFKIDFGRHIERRREERPHEYIQRLVHNTVRSRKKIPCIIFDNADHFTIEFQERVFQYARSIYESEICLVIMPITDRTSWQLSSEGALRSFENESLFLPTPSPKTVLTKRIEYIESRLADEKRESGTGYFLARGIPLSIENLRAFSATLQAAFLKTGQVSVWIGNLANNDIRRCLDITKDIIASPHLKVHELLKAAIADSDVVVPRYKIKRALFKGQYDIYPVGVNSYVRNIYALDEVETTPLLGLRILRLLRDAQKSDASNPFVTFDHIIEYCRAMMIDASATRAWLSRLLEAGLCLSYDPTVTTVDAAGKLELSLAGYQHLRWGVHDCDYAQTMLEVTPLVEREVFDQLTSLGKRPHSTVWRDKLSCFVDYLIAEDEKYCQVQDHPAYPTQKRLTTQLRRMVPQSQRSQGMSGSRIT
jgi:energy-coupling factor transporter ATP-binding protein EcfA2